MMSCEMMIDGRYNMYDRYTSDISAVHQAAALLHSLVRAEVEAGVEPGNILLAG